MRAATAFGLLLCACAAPRAPAPSTVELPAQPVARPLAPRLSATIAPARPPRVVSPFLGNVIQLSVGSSHVCAVTAGYEVVCWGDNAAGELGVGENRKSAAASLSRPHVVGGLPPVSSVAAGVMHTCAIDREGAVWCWGSAGGDRVETKGGAAGSIELHGAALGTPVKMPLGAGAAHLVALAGKGSMACAAFEDEVRCWSTFGTIPIDATTIETPQFFVTRLAGVSAIALGHGKVCAIANGQVSCWRDGLAPTPAARARGDTSKPSVISIGEMYACVGSTTGELRCWWSLIDDFWKKPPNRDVRWKDKSPTHAVAVGDSPICTAAEDGHVDCFLADEGGLPDQAVAQSWATKKLGPHPIAGIDHAIDVGLGLGRNVMGYGFGCALRASPDAEGARVFCWGDNESGQLGRGTLESSRVAVRVVGLAP